MPKKSTAKPPETPKPAETPTTLDPGQEQNPVSTAPTMPDVQPEMPLGSVEKPEETQEPAAETKPEETPKESVKELSEEEIELGRQQFLKKFGYNTVPNTELDRLSKELDEKEAAKTAEKKDEKAPEPKKEETAHQDTDQEAARETEAPRPGIDLEQTADLATSRLAERVKAPEETKPVQAEGPKLSPARRQKLEVLSYMEESVPDYKGAGLRSRAERLWAAEDSYKESWKKANPGKIWDQHSEEHNEFYDNPQNQLNYSQDDYEDALVGFTESKEKEREERHRQEIERIKLAGEIDKQRTQVKASVDQAVDSLISTAAPELKTLDKIEEEDPLLARHVTRHAERVQVLVAELENISRFSDKVQLDPNYVVQLSTGEQIFPHRELINFAGAIEGAWLQMPKEKTTTKDGRTLIAASDYQTMVEKIQKAEGSAADKNRQLRDLAKKHWMVDAEVVKAELPRAAAARARQETEEIRALAQRSGNKLPNQSTPKPNNGAPANPSNTESASRRSSPSALTTPSERTNASQATLPNPVDRDRAIDKAMGW